MPHCREAADGFSPEVATVFAAAADPLFADATPVLAIPEYKVALPGGRRSSQNDLFVLARAASKPISIIVEGKVDEPFGPTLGEWRSKASSGKVERLRFVLDTLGLRVAPPDATRCQLLHRTASALIEAERFAASAAILLVHSFSQKRTGWPDYAAFLALFGQNAAITSLQRVPASTTPPFSPPGCRRTPPS